MRGKSGLLWVIGGVALVAGLVAINVAMRADDSLELEPTAPRRAASETPEPAIEAPAPPPSAAPREADPGDLDPSPPESSEATAAAQTDAIVETEPGEQAASCEHPFVPSAPGQWRRYVWRQSGEPRAAELRIEAISTREIEGGEREVTWRVQVTSAAGDADLASEETTTRCVPGRAAEEPWFGILERSLGAVPIPDPPRWRWPARLRAEQRFEGTASFDTSRTAMRAPEGAHGPRMLRVTRRHVVGAREPVEVPAGHFSAWRVEYEERHAFGERGETGTGTVWVAPAVGMVKSTAENSHGVTQTIELSSFGPRER